MLFTQPLRQMHNSTLSLFSCHVDAIASYGAAAMLLLFSIDAARCRRFIATPRHIVSYAAIFHAAPHVAYCAICLLICHICCHFRAPCCFRRCCAIDIFTLLFCAAYVIAADYAFCISCLCAVYAIRAITLMPRFAATPRYVFAVAADAAGAMISQATAAAVIYL